jgi:subtilisin family serine protease
MTAIKRFSLHFLNVVVLFFLVTSPTFGQEKFQEVADPVTGQYIVVLKDDVQGDPATIAASLAAKYNGKLGHIYDSVYKGFSISMRSIKGAIILSEDPVVKYVTQDNVVTLQSDITQTNAPWNLDRIDQRDLPLSTTYAYPDTLGAGVFVFVLDSGANNHIEFTNWPNSGSRLFPGPNFYGGTNADCDGHGTHVAGIIGGDTYGVSKRPFLIPVKVFGCTGDQSNSAAVIAGINWIKTNSVNITRKVTNMSFSGPPNNALDDAVRSLIASGMPVVIAAGNFNGTANPDAGAHSPARVREAIVVGNVNINDARDPMSNVGTAIDVFAPGENITSAGPNNSYVVKSGTSQAAPHVTGVLANFMTSFPISPKYLQELVTANATMNRLSNVGLGSPNFLLYSGIWSYGGAAMPFYRYKSFSTDSNLYAFGWSEFGAGLNGYIVQEVEGYASEVGDGFTLGPLYRYHNSALNDYIFTMNWNELGNGANGYVFEKIAGYIRWGTNGGATLHRYYNPSIQKHYYTSDFSEFGNGGSGWIYEGITGYFF